jgi:SAM-dependent methyltransferase
MSDDLGMRKSNRRRRTTRRLMRRSIRVPGDDVPRQSKSDLDAIDNDEEQDEEDPMQAGEVDGDRRSSDMLDVDLEGEEVDQPTSGVVQQPPPRSGALSVGASRGVALPAAVALHVPAPATASIPPPGPAVAPERDSVPADEKTNPQIRLAELEAGRASSSKPPPPLAAPVPDARGDEPTRPRIEISDMVMSAVRGAASSRPPPPPAARRSSRPPSEDVDVDTNPRIPIEVEEDVAPVIVTRAHVISDRPGNEPADEDETDTQPPPPRRYSTRPSTMDSEMLEAIDIDDESASKIEIPPNPAVPQGVGPRPPEAQRISKAPPPPPQTGNTAEMPAAEMPQRLAPRRSPTAPALPPSAAPRSPQQAGSQAPQPPGGALKAPPPPPPGGARKQATGPVSVAAFAQKNKRRSWWEDFFSDDYLNSLIRPNPAQVAMQVDFIESSLGLQKGHTVLDVGCGLGQHALELARRGYLVVGLDLSLPMITRAAEAAQQEGLRINFLHSDLREIGFQGMFDGILCMGTTFGFFDDDANRDVLQRLCTSLKPGGKLLLDVVNRDHVIPSQPNLVWFQGDGCVVMEESDFNYFSSRLVVKRTMMREDGRQSDAEYSIRLYALHELGQMMQQVGFRVHEVSGQEATRGVFFGSCSSRIILLAERRAKQNGTVAAAPSDEEAKP